MGVGRFQGCLWAKLICTLPLCVACIKGPIAIKLMGWKHGSSGKGSIVQKKLVKTENG